MDYPKIKFRKSAAQDYRTALAFADEAHYSNGETLEWGLFNDHPRVRGFFDGYEVNQKGRLKDYIQNVYRSDMPSMKLALSVHQKNWERVAPEFYELVDGLFNGRAWPKGMYVAYGTIWTMYPRFLDNKTFQIPYRHKKPSYVPVIVAHEMLHFMFYDYFLSRYKKYGADKYHMFVWNVSEIFNEVVQGSPKWLEVFGDSATGYPQHEKIVARLQKRFYKKDIELEELVGAIIKEVQKK